MFVFSISLDTVAHPNFEAIRLLINQLNIFLLETVITRYTELTHSIRLNKTYNSTIICTNGEVFDKHIAHHSEAFVRMLIRPLAKNFLKIKVFIDEKYCASINFTVPTPIITCNRLFYDDEIIEFYTQFAASISLKYEHPPPQDEQIITRFFPLFHGARCRPYDYKIIFQEMVLKYI